MTIANDKVFAGSIPEIYQSHLVPLIFEPYAQDLARRLSGRRIGSLLEVAAGTGVVTRALDRALPAEAKIVATDLNAAMIERAKTVGTRRAVDWRTADAMALPFEDATFDAVACQFGVMFFPDKVHAFAEARRVLRPGGALLFNVWDRIQENDFANTIFGALRELFPKDPPRFIERTPHGYHDVAAIRRDLAAGGFGDVHVETIAARSVAPTAAHVAIAFCQGTPWRGEIEARGSLQEATDAARRALEAKFGTGPVDGKIQAHVFTAAR